MESEERAARRLLSRQLGVISCQQASAIGVSANGLQHRTRSRSWQRLLPGVYLTKSGQPTWDQMEVAAALYAGPGSVITGLAALRVNFIDCLETRRIDMLIPVSRRRMSVGFVVAHRTRRMPELVGTRGIVAYALVPRALADALDGLTRLSDARTLVASAVQQRRCTVDELRQELATRNGRECVLLRRVLAEVAEGMQSAPECELGDLIRPSGLPQPLYNARLYVNGKFLAQPDAWWQEASVAVEVDSMRWHLLPEHWEKTMLRHRRMSAAGIVVIHLSPHQLRTQPQEVIADIARALANGRPATSITIRPGAA
jgi:hypothetical protein